MWRGNDSHVPGHVHEIIRKTRAEYNYDIRQVKSKQDLIRKPQFARALSENNSRNVWWRAVNKIRNRNTSCAHYIDAITGVNVRNEPLHLMYPRSFGP